VQSDIAQQFIGYIPQQIESRHIVVEKKFIPKIKIVISCRFSLVLPLLQCMLPRHLLCLYLKTEEEGRNVNVASEEGNSGQKPL